MKLDISLCAIVDLLCVAMLLSFTVLDTNNNISIVIGVLLMAILTIDMYINKLKIKIKYSQLYIYILFFSIYCSISSLWAIDSQSQALQRGITVFELLLCVTVVFSHYAKRHDIHNMLTIIIVSGGLSVIYAYLYYGSDVIMTTLQAGGRLRNSFTNINTIGMVASIVIIAIVFDFLYIERTIFRVKYLFAIPCLFMLAASGTRKGLIVILFGMFLLIIKKYLSKSVLKNIVDITLYTIFFLIIMYIVLQLPLFSGILERMTGFLNLFKEGGAIDESTWERNQFIVAGLEQFYKTPFFGIGIDNSGVLTYPIIDRYTYLHNNYIELMAGGGIIGLILYYAIYMYAIFRLYRLSRFKDEYSFLCLVFLLILLLLDFGVVSYFSKDRYFYLTMIYVHISILEKQKLML